MPFAGDSRPGRRGRLKAGRHALRSRQPDAERDDCHDLEAHRHAKVAPGKHGLLITSCSLEVDDSLAEEQHQDAGNDKPSSLTETIEFFGFPAMPSPHACNLVPIADDRNNAERHRESCNMITPFRLLASTIFGLVTLCAGLSGAEARMIEVNVQNETPNTIYKLYAWPADLVPRTYSIIPSPIQPGQSKTVSIEDVYNSCVFTFQSSFTNPVKPKNRLRKITYYPDLYKYKVDICPPAWKKNRAEVQTVKMQPIAKAFQ